MLSPIYILIYSVLLILSIHTLIIFYYKVKYPFWNKLNAFHKYKWWYWFYNQKIIDYIELSRESNYYNKNYNTLCVDNNIENKTLTPIIDFINKNYMNYSDALYSIAPAQLKNIYSKSTYLTLCYDETTNIKGTLISIPFLMWCKDFKINNNETNKYKKENTDFIHINYVDYLCVAEKQRKQNIAPTIIYSHLVNVKNIVKQHQDENLYISNYDKIKHVFLFKNEGFSTKALVPVVEYTGYVIDLDNITLTACNENTAILEKHQCSCKQLIPTNKELLNNVINIIYTISNFDKYGLEFVSLFPKEMLINHIISNDIIIYCLFKQNTIVGLYLFKNIHSLIDNNKYEFISLCSLNLFNKSNNYYPPFIYGFKLACVLCKNHLNNLYCVNTKYSYDLCCVEDISHNHHIITKARINSKYKYKIPLNYYTYNGLIHTKHSSKILIIS
jgi:hypothetical protein